MAEKTGNSTGSLDRANLFDHFALEIVAASQRVFHRPHPGTALHRTLDLSPLVRIVDNAGELDRPVAGFDRAPPCIFIFSMAFTLLSLSPPP